MTDQPEPTWLSPAAAQKLQDEYDHLTTAGRIEATERIAEARSHGDIRENADYDAAKNEQGFMEARIRKIRHLLENSEIREAASTDEVSVGCVVTVKDQTGDEMEFFVATPENAAPGFLMASPSSPLGAALLGAKPGEEVAYQAPGGTFTYEVVAIRPFEG